ncbi:MAG: HIT family protein [Flavobacteriaceae bacterium]|nr:HIT family protein [Flavobacteriaceae bacterium]MBT3753734.1 HIT family protein [Flavobacteriaceae bacterium]MBT3794296.1 HIT family protein [Flavobacteriaceae bacterium]MBT4246460.1 HIT family protein [Flavobacteriaceae bacterium]MBT4416136.1 HIT family protein [Flavobacteriaceae bacterium]
MTSIFTKIINNEIPCYKVAETENCFAFLDINPNAEGHTLCIPKQEVDNLFDLDTKLYNELMMFSKKVAKALKKAIPCERVAMSVIGLEVPHAHVHLIPINEMKDVTFRNKVIFSKNEFQDIANNIKSYL